VALGRFAYRWGVKRAQRELEELLGSLASSMSSADVFGEPAALPPSRPATPGEIIIT
jgi:hypothetical protein